MIKDIGERADDVRIEYLSDCGHSAEERPDVVAEHLRKFFALSDADGDFIS